MTNFNQTYGYNDENMMPHLSPPRQQCLAQVSLSGSCYSEFRPGRDSMPGLRERTSPLVVHARRRESLPRASPRTARFQAAVVHKVSVDKQRLDKLLKAQASSCDTSAAIVYREDLVNDVFASVEQAVEKALELHKQEVCARACPVPTPAPPPSVPCSPATSPFPYTVLFSDPRRSPRLTRAFPATPLIIQNYSVTRAGRRAYKPALSPPPH